MKTTKHSLLTSLVALVLCITMLIGTTFAWFTDAVSSANNIIKAGNLDVGMQWSKDNVNWKNAEGTFAEPVLNYDKWEPGYTEVRYIKVTNDGSLAFKYQMLINPTGTVGKLADVIDVSCDVVTGNTNFRAPASMDDMGSLTKIGTLKGLIASSTAVASGVLLPDGATDPAYQSGETVICLSFHMQETAGNEFQDESIGDAFGINLYATQFAYENDSFGNSYDDNAEWPDMTMSFEVSKDISGVATVYGELATDLTIKYSNTVYAVLPAGVKLESGVSSLKFSGKSVETDSNITVGEGESAESYDIHIEGIADDNNKPIYVYLGAMLEKGISDTALKLYHENTLMTRVNDVSDFSINNQFTYNSATGDVVLYVDNFSVFSATVTAADDWDGTSDTSWYNENDTEFTLNTAEEFAGFRDLVDAGNTFAGKTVKLGKDIDLADKLFDPIGFGYYNAETNTRVFMGTFDGANHTVYNLYENCWELDPDKVKYSTYTYSTAGAGLFASIKDATIKNLAVSGANIVFECVDMGVVVGYAQGTCHFENIVVTDSKIANYNRYTGGVVGEVSYGPYGIDTSLGYSHTFKNITVDSSVKVSGLWGSFGCGMGGVIGGKWNDATVKMENVISAAEMDVFNDVTSAYQWYAFRGCGMLIGHTEEPYADGRHSGNATASFLTCENVKVYYGDWVNYNYYQFTNQTDKDGNRLWYSDYPWVRAEVGEHNAAFSNPRYGNPIVNGVAINTLELAQEHKTGYTTIVFDQLYGADLGMYGTATHEGVTVNYDLEDAKTVYIFNDQGWENLKLHYWYRNGEDTWSTVGEDGISMEYFKVENCNVYRLEFPGYVDGFKITANDSKEVSFALENIENGDTYTVASEKHEHDFGSGNECECGAQAVTKWEKLTDDSNLKIGDVVIFVYEDSKMELSSFSTSSTIYGIGEEYDTIPKGLMPFEVVEGSTSGTVAFKNGDKYLYWTSGNSLDMNGTLSKNTSWTVTVENENATVKNANDQTRVIQWNASSPRFACYTSTQRSISIYLKNSDVLCSECTLHEVERREATCEAAGFVTERCTVCGNTTTTTLNPIGHNYTGSNPYLCVNNCGVANLPANGETITIQQALWIAEALENGKETANKYIITGVIDDEDQPSITGATTITSDDVSIYITNIHNVDGTVRYDSFTVKPENGNTITVSAKIAKNDAGEAQLHETWMNEHVDSDTNDTCDYCGATIGGSTEPTPDPEEPAETTVSMDIFANQGELANDVITWVSGDVTVSNAKGSSSSNINTTDVDLFRVYAKSTFTISAENIQKLVITCTSTSYATACKTSFENAGCTATSDGSVVTITLAAPEDSITVTASAQFRLNKVEVTYTPSGSDSGDTPTPEPEHECTSICATCGKCTNVECEYDVCKNNQCEGHSSTESTVVLEITKDDFNSTSYAANNNEKTENGYSYTSYQVMNQSSAMQWQKNNGYITLTSNDFVKLEIKVTAGTYTVTVGGETVTGTTTNGVTTYDLTGLTGEIKISVGSATGKVDYIKFYK